MTVAARLLLCALASVACAQRVAVAPSGEADPRVADVVVVVDTLPSVDIHALDTRRDGRVRQRW